jgi:type IV secretory pathway VirB3-like protein
MFSSPTLSHSFSLILLQAKGYSLNLKFETLKVGTSTTMMIMGIPMWLLLLVPLFVMMVLIGNRGEMMERMKKWVVAHIMERRKRRERERIVMMMEGKTERTTHRCGNMSQILGVEPQNLHAPIVE